MKKALLFLIFNRLEATKEVFKQIKTAKPPKLYIASDGARPGVAEETETVKKIRDHILKNIDWECEVKTLFREENMGCGKAISNAIAWFFENEEDGIILEDDCVPEQAFFNYCETLLDFYKDNKKIWHISGFSQLDGIESEESYYFSKFLSCWGWATWADRWKHYKFDIKDYDNKIIKNLSKRKSIQLYWLNTLLKMKKQKIDTWDYQWMFTITKNQGICINPYKSLVSNIGLFGTHYAGKNHCSLLNKPSYSLEHVIHPKDVTVNEKMNEAVLINILQNDKVTFKSVLLYIKRHPIFLFRKNFWICLNTLYLTKDKT